MHISSFKLKSFFLFIFVILVYNCISPSVTVSLIYHFVEQTDCI